jgi:hypothetical protein
MKMRRSCFQDVRLSLFLTGAIVTAAVGLGGCARSPAPTKAGLSSPAPPRVTDVGARPTEDEAKEFASELIAAIDADDVNKFNNLVDWNALFDQVTGGIEVAADWKRGFQTGFLGSLTKPGGLFAGLAGVRKAGGSFTLLRVHDVEGRPRALIREVLGEGGFNYLDFELARRPGGKVRATDFYIFLSGERISKTIRGVYLPLAASQSRSILEKLVTSESDLVKAFPKIGELTKSMRNGQPKEALAIYDSLPSGAKKEKSVMLLRLQAAQATNDDSLYLAAMDDLRNTFPSDPCVDLISIDAFVLHKEYDKAKAAIDGLDKNIGGDPYLKVIGSTILAEQGKYDEAARLVQTAVDADPTFPEAHYGRLQIANGQKKYGDMVRFLGEYEAEFHEEMEGIENDPNYAGFVASPEFQQYKNKHGKKL